MDLGIRGKVALVTGSTAGIGRAVAEELARAGAEVVVNGRTQGRVDAAVEAVREAAGEGGGGASGGGGSGGGVRGIAADLATAEGAEAVRKAVPRVDILVNNLGIFEPKDFFEIPDEDWVRFFEVNVLSGVRLARLYMEGMMGRGWGRVVFVSSESAVQIPQEMIHYGMTKTAQIAVARGLAELTTGTGVTVNSVLPGPTWSEGVETFVERIAEGQGMTREEIEGEFFNSVRPTSLLRRFITVEEVAAMVAYVCSARASATNGAALRVEGGVVKAAL